MVEKDLLFRDWNNDSGSNVVIMNEFKQIE